MLTIHNADALTALRQMDAESVQMCVTSPPYWGLRDYGIEPLVWDGDPDCVHQWGSEIIGRAQRQRNGVETGIHAGRASNQLAEIVQTEHKQGSFCHCGAWRGSLGLEPTPDLYVQHLVQIFREVRRVLRNDATLWLNLGDSYNAAGRDGHGTRQGCKQGTNRASANGSDTARPTAPDLKPKDLVGIPWMAAFALRADGWWLRMDVIWNKPAPMPESVTDRPTKSHEYIFLLTKSQKYYYDHEAIKEPAVATHGSGNGYKRDARLTYGGRGSDEPYTMRSKRDSFKREGSKREQAIPGQSQGTHRPNRDEDDWDTTMRNKRSVWTVNTKPFNDAHFATFPPELVTPCILAGSKAGDTVLDICAGSGTVGKVAIELGRRAVLIEPNPEYCKMIEQRTTTTIGLPM